MFDIRSAIQANITNPYQLKSCYDIDAAFKDIDFEAVETALSEQQEALDQDGNGNLITGDGYSVSEGVATINIRGLLVPDLSHDLTSWGITGYDMISAYIKHANETAENEKIERIRFDINSGGGFTRGISGVLASIENSELPFETFASGTMASAAYHIGCTVNNITAASSSNIVGSIGVIATHYNYKKAMENEGVEQVNFISGFWKDAFSSHKPLSKKAARALQEEVEESALVFFKHVSTYRLTLSTADVKNLQAATFSSKKALQHGLIDSIADLDTNKTSEKGSKAMADTQTETNVDATAGMLSQEQAQKIADDAVTAALAKAETEKNEAVTRATTLSEHDAPQAVKDVLATDGFANVSNEDHKSLLDAIPKGFSQQMDDTGGAGVELDAQEISDAAKLKADKEKSTIENQEKLKNLTPIL